MKPKKSNTQMEFKYLFFARAKEWSLWCKGCIDFKKILQMGIWLENVLKGNLVLQFSWLEEFC